MPSLSAKAFPAASLGAGHSAARKPKHLYLGPGYSSQAILRRRQRLAPGAGDLRSVKSEAHLGGVSVKRRRMEEAPLDLASIAPSTPSSHGSFGFPAAHSNNTPTALGSFSANGGLTGPRIREFKPPTLSAPATAPIAQPSPETTPKKTTRAADIMLDIIRSAEEARPVRFPNQRVTH
jgi:hypothetical protein